MGTPYIQLYDAPYGGAVELLPSLKQVWRMNRAAIFDRTWESVSVYTESGRKLKPRPNELGLPRKNIWSVFAVFFYDPLREVRFLYEEIGSFELEEIKTKILAYVAKDDDILTQFLDGDEIRMVLEGSNTFPDLVRAIEIIQGQGEVV